MEKYYKKLTKEYYLKADSFKDQLKNEIIKDNQRINVDSAKKKAVDEL